jgi:NADPH:quinone reductase-like Zn-dependent oxidoreductase
MKAIWHTNYGPSDELQLKEVEKPVPEDNEVLIRIHATTVTSSDCNIRNLTFAPTVFKPLASPGKTYDNSCMDEAGGASALFAAQRDP